MSRARASKAILKKREMKNKRERAKSGHVRYGKALLPEDP
jgi:hypothetical protein